MSVSMSDQINIVILAAGKGTRLKLDIAKPLCPFLNKTLVDFALKGVSSFLHKSSYEGSFDFVVGHQAAEVEQYIRLNHSDKKTKFILQAQQLGTGHALQTYFEQSPESYSNPYTIVMCADTPLIPDHVFTEMFKMMEDTQADVVVTSFKAFDPFGYGRIIHEGDGIKIVEQKDANKEEQAINEVNSGLYLFKTEHIKKTISTLNSNNSSNEFYLTDLVKPEFNCVTYCSPKEDFFTGVNNLADLEKTQKSFMQAKVEELQSSGVIIHDTASVYIEDNVSVASGTVIFGNVHLFTGTTIEENVILEPGVIVKGSHVAAGAKILAYSYVENAKIGSQASIGPFARLREGSEIGSNCKIGNFVETKKAKLEPGVKVSHLSYVGDAQVGEDTNIGCGFITCNYDGKEKHQTIIGSNSFVGSDCQTIAPVKIGDRAYIGSGSTINKDVPDDAFAIARQRQVTKEKMAKKFLKNPQ